MGSASQGPGAESPGATVLYVDRTPSLAERTATRLEEAGGGMTVVPVAGADAALDRLPAADCVVSEYRLGETDGLSLCERVRERDDAVPFLLYTSASVARQAAAARVTDYLRKDGTDDQLTWLAHRVCDCIEGGRGPGGARSGGTNGDRDGSRFRALVEHAPSITGVLGRGGRFEYVGPAVERVLGRRPADLVGEPLVDVVHPEDRDRVREALTRAVERDTRRVALDHRLEHADGTPRAVETTVVDHLADPAVEGVVVVSRDVTARRRAERTRDGAFGVAAALLAAADEPLAVLEPDGRVQAASDAAPYLAGAGPLTLTPLWNGDEPGEPRKVLADATGTVSCRVSAGGDEHIVEATPVRVEGTLARAVLAFER